MLVVWFALPIWDDEGSEDVKDTLADFDLCTIADEFIHCAACTDGVFEGVDKFGAGFHAVDVNDVGQAADKDLRTGVPSDGGDGRGYGVGGNGLVSASHVEHWKWRLIRVTDCGTELDAASSVLCGVIISVLYDVSWAPQEVWLEACEVRFVAG